jgi:fatty-acyl-CoA synthase
MIFSDLLKSRATERPDAVAYYDVDQPVSNLSLATQADRVAALLLANGARPGDRLALWLPSCTEWLVTFMACARLGMTVVSMNTRFRGQEVGDLIERGNCRWLAMWPTFKGIAFGEILAGVEAQQLKPLQGIMTVGQPGGFIPPTGTRVFNYLDQTDCSALQSLPLPSGDTHALVYTTSGTTSRPKLVVHDQQTLLRHGTNVARYFGIKANDTVLLGAPLCGAFGFSAALGGLAGGASLAASPVINPVECAQQIQTLRVTHTFANNELLDRILDTAGDTSNPFPSLRVAGFASFAPSLDTLPQRAEQAGITLVGLYGSSELQALIAGRHPDAPLSERILAGGRLTAPEARVRARDIDTGALLPHGQVGEIEIYSPSLMREYLDNPQATAQAIDSQGYFRTGDLGATQDDQSFIFHARRGDFLRLGGFLVNPVEIEQFIERHANVQACQVVGVSHQGKTVAVGFVIAEPDTVLDEASLLAHCKAQLAGFKIPARIAVINEFPVVQSANSNKIQRGKLQELALELLQAQA